jgi:CheY-like chemotaxis protein
MVSKILIIDDDDEDRELFCLTVASVDTNVECVEAIDGEKGLAYLTTCNTLPDFIFLDLNMPRISGLQTLEMIKNHPTLTDIPVVIYTTSKSRSEQQKCKQLGAVHFITKPDKIDDLKNAVKFVLERKWEKIDSNKHNG